MVSILRIVAFGCAVAGVVALIGYAIDQSLAEHSRGGRQQKTLPAGGIGTAVVCFTRQNGKVVCRESR